MQRYVATNAFYSILDRTDRIELQNQALDIFPTAPVALSMRSRSHSPEIDSEICGIGTGGRGDDYCVTRREG
jgi:hypothetical protein